jgi:hypothetical protein
LPQVSPERKERAMQKSVRRVKSSSRRNFLKGVTAISVAGIGSHSSSTNGMEKESLASAPAASQPQIDIPTDQSEKKTQPSDVRAAVRAALTSGAAG